jgi:hypothetical protein
VKLLIGGKPTVRSLTTPLGLTGTRGAGAQVYVAFTLEDTEFNPCDIQLEYGYDFLPPFGVITGSSNPDDPSPDDEYFPCFSARGDADTIGLDSARNRGADHLFIWDSAHDISGGRFVTQDYQYTPQGRQILGSDGKPLFGATPGIKLRMRANDNGGAPDRWGPWTLAKNFDLNNNRQPSASIGAIGMNGVTLNLTGAAADEDVVLNINCIDEDSVPTGANDLQAVAVDFAVAPVLVDMLPATDANGDGIPDGDGVPETPFNASNPIHLKKLQWFPASTFPGTADTGLTTSSAPGTAHTFTWDSVKDVGTVNGNYILRVTPFDSKKELGPTVAMPGGFKLDNYTIFTDSGASLSAARIGHRVTTLADNRVLITGGRTTATGASVSTAELFYPGIGQTTFGAVAGTGSMGSPRAYHSQTRLQDDRVLAAGGFDASGSPLTSIEVYNPVGGTWSTLPVSLAAARARHTAVLLASGDVLFAGGVDGSGNALLSAEIYHVDTNTVTTVPGGMAAGRHSVSGALLPDARVLIPGGKNTAGSPLSSTEIYDPVANSFSAGNPMAAARAEHSVSSTVDGRVIVTGGVGLNTIEVFNPRTGGWSSVGPTMSSARAGHVGVIMGDGNIVVAGGSNGANVVGSADLFSPSSLLFDVPNGGMKTARRDAASTILNNGRVLIVGGEDNAGATLSSIEVFTPDNGFNYGPTAKITTPQDPQSWAFGALFPYRLIDPELNHARVIFQYSIAGAPWKPCTSKGGFYLDATNDPDTIAGDINEGTVDLVTTAADAPSLPIDPILHNTIGDHLFIWDMTADIVKNDYAAVKVRVIPFGASRGVMATSTSFPIAKNTRVIPKFEGFAAPVHGSIDVWYQLRDIDGVPGIYGDSARIEMEYGVDLNGDKQIIAADGETWKTCTEVVNPAGSEGLGAGYSLLTSKNYAARGTDPTGWHLFRWDSIRDVGSPDIGVIRTNVLLRITPYDNPDLFPPVSNPLAQETKGRQETLSSTPANGLKLDLDTTNGLFLTKVENEGGTQSYTTFPAVSGAIPFTNIKLDETIIFTFNKPVDPASVDGLVGLNSLKVMVGTRQILGGYRSDTPTSKVYFYPLLQEIKDNVPKYTRAVTETQTILFRGDTASVVIPGFVAGTNPETALILRQNGWVSGTAAVKIANLLARNYASAFSTTATAGLGAFVVRGGPSAPNLVGNATGATTITLTFKNQISGDSANLSVSPNNLRFRVDQNANGVVDANDPVVYGKYQITNTAGTLGGTAGSVISFVIDAAYSFPTGSQIIVDFTGLTSADGTLATGGTAGTFTFVTGGASTTTPAPFFETFTSTAQDDTTATTALWNNAAFPGMLTGLRDGGTGADGTFAGDTFVSPVRTFSGKSTYNFTSVNIPVGETWRFTGTGSNLPVSVLVTGSVDIYGILDVSGAPGQTAIQDVTGYGSYVLYVTFDTTPLKGGLGVAGGGKGADAQFTSSTYTNIAGLVGTAGSGAPSNGPGGGGTNGSSYSAGGAGGGGGGHAQAGQAGGVYATGSSSYGTAGVAGVAYGSTTFASGITAGSGGGSGVMSNYAGAPYYMKGGGGGAGGGALKILANGSVFVHGTGLINASGGRGGGGYYYFAGCGGGGSGGAVWIVSGGGLTLNGRIDVRGGLGGTSLYYSGSSYSSGGKYGVFGGDGSAGRVRLEGPSIGTTTTNFIAGLAQATIASGSLNGGSGVSGAFPGSSTTTINIDTISKTSGYMNFTTMNIPAGVTVTMTGSTAALMRFTGNVSISGVLQSNGATGVAGTYGSGSTSSYPAQTAATAGVGGGAGGITNSSKLTSFPTSAGGTGGGTGGGKSGSPSKYDPYGWGGYAYYDGGGGGGSNLKNTPGVDGLRTRYSNGYYVPSGTGNGGAGGTTYTDPETMAIGSLTGGSGGGPGGMGAYNTWGSSSSWNTFYGGGNGGAGGGAVGIETIGSFTMGAAGKIAVLGGTGGAAYTLTGGGGAGGGSGGNVLVRASSVTYSTGSAVDTSGGLGMKAYNYAYYDMYNNGGNGGPGAFRVESVTAPTNVLNTGALLGYSTTTGSLTTAVYLTGDTGTTFWVKAAGLAPDYKSGVITSQGNMQINLQGAMLDPITGARSTTLTGTQDIKAVPLTTGAPFNAIDGYIWNRFQFKLAVPSIAVPQLPELYDITMSYQYH